MGEYAELAGFLLPDQRLDIKVGLHIKHVGNYPRTPNAQTYVRLHVQTETQ